MASNNERGMGENSPDCALIHGGHVGQMAIGVVQDRYAGKSRA